MNQAPYQQAQPQTTVIQMQQAPVPSEYQPIGAWAYFGWKLLFSLPLVGLIMILVFSLGGTSNINLKNFSRSYVIDWLIVLGIILLSFLVLMIIGLVTGVGIFTLIPWDELTSGLGL